MRFETERLILREITQEDFDNWYEILADAETMKHYPAPYDASGVQRWIDWTLNNYAQHGFGLWAVILKETGEFIEEYDDPGHGPTRVYAITREEWEENRRRNAQIQSA